MKPEIAIIGGGYAGLACAVTLARADVRVTVFESSRVLGGRARVVEKDGSRIDNGQHIMIGAYSQTLQLMRQVGVSPKVDMGCEPPQGLWTEVSFPPPPFLHW